MKALDDDGSERIVMAPSGVQKERMEPRDMFVLDSQGNVLHTPEARPPPYRPPKLSECQPLFTSVGVCTCSCSSNSTADRDRATKCWSCLAALQAYELRGAGAVLHSHSLNAVMATMLDPNATEFRVTHIEMIKVSNNWQEPPSKAEQHVTGRQ